MADEGDFRAVRAERRLVLVASGRGESRCAAGGEVAEVQIVGECHDGLRVVAVEHDVGRAQEPPRISGSDAWQRVRHFPHVEQRHARPRCRLDLHPVHHSRIAGGGPRPRVVGRVDPGKGRCRFAAEVHVRRGTVDVVEGEPPLLRLQGHIGEQARKCKAKSTKSKVGGTTAFAFESTFHFALFPSNFLPSIVTLWRHSRFWARRVRSPARSI